MFLTVTPADAVAAAAAAAGPGMWRAIEPAGFQVDPRGCFYGGPLDRPADQAPQWDGAEKCRRMPGVVYTLPVRTRRFFRYRWIYAAPPPACRSPHLTPAASETRGQPPRRRRRIRFRRRLAAPAVTCSTSGWEPLGAAGASVLILLLALSPALSHELFARKVISFSPPLFPTIKIVIEGKVKGSHEKMY